MSGERELAESVSNAIRDGTFPESNDALSAQLSSVTAAALLESILRDRKDLEDEIEGSSHSLDNSTDDWIKRANKVQEDIAKCKDDARSIVEEHTRLQVEHGHLQELGQKLRFLESEIAFAASLTSGLQSIQRISTTLQKIEALLANGHAAQAAHALSDATEAFADIRGPKVLSLLRDYESDLRKRARQQLEDSLHELVFVSNSAESSILEVRTPSAGADINDIVTGFRALDVFEPSLQPLTTDIHTMAVQSLKRKSRTHPQDIMSEGGRLSLRMGPEQPTVSDLIKVIPALWSFIRKHLPPQVTTVLAKSLMPPSVETLVNEWMTPAIPLPFHELDRLDELQQQASQLLNYLESNDWPGASDLAAWIEYAPRMWLTKRKADTLGSVRRLLTASKGILRQVKRTERQKASMTAVETHQDEPDDGWNASWNQTESQQQESNAEDTSGWGFDDEEQLPIDQKARDSDDQAQGDEADAWGWTEDDAQATSGEDKSDERPLNGGHDSSRSSKEIILTELYTITDIPDQLIEVIRTDVQDSFRLSEEPNSSLSNVAASKGLLSLPTVALAMYRAVAPIHYDNAVLIGNMNLYNDALYIKEELQRSPVLKDIPSLELDCKAMEKFARFAYSKEMEIQRTILTDLLDGVQGFTGCTQPLYAREIDNAISSTVDRIRLVHAEWKSVLSTSALLQSTGALLTSILGKVITDVEEMDEISAPMSEKLVSYCAQISSLEDLFLAKPPGVGEGDEEAVPMTAVYVSNWLKFQYLVNILDSSLVDIKYLWTEGELSLEFTQEEVIDLIEALFQESSHRRSAIAAIKSSRNNSR